MGCVSAKPSNQVPSDKSEMSAKKRQAALQRRRLSVAPEQVGDIDAAAAAAAAAAASDVDEKQVDLAVVGDDDSELSQLQRVARGGMRHATLSRKGFVPYNRNKVNQDRAFVVYAMQDDPEINAFGVMDGHGEFGHLVAEFVRVKLPMYLNKQADLKTNPEKALLKAVKELTGELATTNINISFSGSTLVFAVLVRNMLYVANVGDSRCVLFTNKGGKCVSKALSFDQKPENPEEKKRILQAGGRVEPLPGPPGEDCGPPRVWLAQVDVPGLAMSRSIGDDVSQTVGVISVPEIVRYRIKKGDEFLVWASDGVWEFLSNDAVGEIVWPLRRELGKAAAALVQRSHQEWSKNEEVVDDITCVILNVENFLVPNA